MKFIIPCIAKTIATNAPLLFLVEYSDMIMAETGYIAPMPIPKKNRQKDRVPTTAAPLAPKEKDDRNAKIIIM